MRPAPEPVDTASRRHRLITAGIWAAAGLTIIVALAGILLAAGPTRPTATGAKTSTPTVEPGLDTAAATLLQLDLLPVPLNTAPDFTLTDQNGKKVNTSQYRGKSVARSFNDDECEDLCTLLAQDVAQANHDLGPAASDVVFLSVNANTQHPAVADVKTWTKDHGLDSEPNWVFGTGTPAQLATVAAQYHVPVGVDPETHDVVHGSELFFINPDGKEAAIGQFGTESANTALFARAMAQMAVNLVPGRAGTTVSGPASSAATTASPATLGKPAPGLDPGADEVHHVAIGAGSRRFLQELDIPAGQPQLPGRHKTGDARANNHSPHITPQPVRNSRYRRNPPGAQESPPNSRPCLAACREHGIPLWRSHRTACRTLPIAVRASKRI